MKPHTTTKTRAVQTIMERRKNWSYSGDVHCHRRARLWAGFNKNEAFKLRHNGDVKHLIVVVGAACLGLSLMAQTTFTGRWVAELINPDGEHRDTTFFLKQSGDALTGAILQNYRMQDIAEGKVSGDEASWVIVTRQGGQDRRNEYHAKLTGGELHVS